MCATRRVTNQSCNVFRGVATATVEDWAKTNLG